MVMNITAIASVWLMAIIRLVIVSRMKAMGIWRALGEPSAFLYFDAYLFRFPFLRDPRFSRLDRAMMIAYPMLGLYGLSVLAYGVWTKILSPR
jgi:hypothetical protein